MSSGRAASFRNDAEIGEEVVAKLFVEGRTDRFVTGGKAEALYGFYGELAVKPVRAFNRYFPVAELLIGENS